MKIILAQKHPLEILPPLISLMRILRRLGHEVYYIGLSSTDASIKCLKEIGVTYSLYKWPVVTFRDHPILRMAQKVLTPLMPIIFRNWMWKMIYKFVGDDERYLLWSHSMNTASLIGDRALGLGKRHVVTLYDLGDEFGSNLLGFNIRKLYESATIVECEYNRAHILMAEKKLRALPFILPNKPYPPVRKRNMRVENELTAKIVASWYGKKVILYQGALQADRGDLFNVIGWLCEGFPDFIVAVMGKRNDMVRELEKRYENFCHVPPVPPPSHLAVTSCAHIGIAIYNGGSVFGLSPINAIYCAPNKIFEYAGFGMPVLCNDIPGLRYTIGAANAGICISELTKDSVSQAVKDLFKNYEYYSKNASDFYNSVDSVGLVSQIVNVAGGEQ